jgi:hypothetical protein
MGKENACWFGRYRSDREKAKAVKLDFEKQLLKLGRERKMLWQKKQKLGYEPLVPPVQKGFKRFFVLRDDVAKSPRAEFFLEILDKINTIQYSDTRQFTKTKRYHGRKIRLPKEQFLDSISGYEWDKLKLPPEQQIYFEEMLESTAYREWQRVFKFTQPWRFRLKIAPNLITRVSINDADLEKRLDEIDNYLERNSLEAKLQRLLHGSANGSFYKSYEKPGYANPLKNKPLDWILEMAKQDGLPKDHP